jgi:hypothetical protein
MKKKLLILAILSIVALNMPVSAQNKSTVNVGQDREAVKDNITQILFHDISAGEAGGLRNPERGLRLEVALNVDAPYYNTWNPEENFPEITARLEQEVRKYEADSITLVQTYFYLTGIAGKLLEQRHFDAIRCANSDTEWTVNDEEYGINNLITIDYQLRDAK